MATRFRLDGYGIGNHQDASVLEIVRVKGILLEQPMLDHVSSTHLD